MAKKKKGEKRAQTQDAPVAATSKAPVTASDGWIGENSTLLLLGGAVLAVVVTFLIYGQTLATPAIQYEDTFYLLRSPYVAVADPMSRLGPVWKEAYFANFHPLTTTTWLIDRTFANKSVPFDSHPFRTMHLVYVAVGSALLVLLYRQLGLTSVLAVLGALLFAAHPAKTEMGGWLSARKDAVVLITATLAFVSYLRARKSETPNGWWLWHALTAVLSLAAFLSKPVAIVLPALFIAWEFCADTARSGSGRLSPALVRTGGLTAILVGVGGPLAWVLSSSLEKQTESNPLRIAIPIVLAALLIAVAPPAQRLRAFLGGTDNGLRVLGPPMAVHAVVFASGVAWTMWSQSAVGAIKGGLTIVPTLNLAFDVLLSYTAKMFVPMRLSASYTWIDYPYVSAMGAAGAVLILGLAGLGLYLGRRADRHLRLTAFGIFWFLICFIPVANLTPTSTKMADRYLMLPSIGAILAVCSALSWFAAKRKPLQIPILVGLLVVTGAYTVFARERTTVWSGTATTHLGLPDPDLSIWTAAVNTDPRDFLAMTNLSTVYLGFSPPEPDKAIDMLQRALAIATEEMNVAGGKKFDTSQITENLSDAYMSKVRALNPVPENAALRKEFLALAVKYFDLSNQHPMAFIPMRVRFLRNMSDAKEQLSKVEPAAAVRDTLRSQSIAALEEARRVLKGSGASNEDPDFRDTLLAMGNAYFSRGDVPSPQEQLLWFGKALEVYTEGSTLFPDDARPVTYVGLCYERLRLLLSSPAEKQQYFEKSEAAFRKGLTLRGDFPEFHRLVPYRGLGKLYSDAGDYCKAIETFKIVREKDPAFSRSSLNEQDIQVLEQFVGGKCGK